MRNYKESIIKFFRTPLSDILIIAIVTIIAHGLLIYWLGFYTDDWTFLWTYHRYGTEGLTQYFSTNRPFWGLLYQLTMPLLGIKPLVWHIFALFWGLMASLSTYWLVRKVWPKNTLVALLAGLFFSVYPGFLLQPLAITFGHIYIIYTIFILSLVLTVLALKSNRYEVPLTIASLLLSAINLLAMEYFYTLEGVRLLLIIYIVSSEGGLQQNFKKIIKKYLPYFTVLLLISIWRAFFFDVQTYNYDISLLTSFKNDFFNTLYGLVLTLFKSIYNSTYVAWIQPITSIVNNWRATTFYYLMFAVIVFSILTLGIILVLKNGKYQGFSTRLVENKSIILLGLAALILAGWPFYLTDLPVIPSDFNSRFTLPFILGGVIFLAGIIETIPSKWLKISLASILISSSIGYHINNQYDFRYVTKENNQIISQLLVRIPSLEPGTTILSDEGSIYFTMTTLTAQLNLIYDPPPAGEVNFGWIFPRDLENLTTSPFQKDSSFDISLVTTTFHGNTDEVVSLQMAKGSCLYILDRELEATVPQLIHYKTWRLTDKSLILQENKINDNFGSLFNTDESLTWCQIYQQADLALQFKDFTKIASLYNMAEDSNLIPLQPAELYPFIEAFGSLGNFEKAKQITDRSMDMNYKFDRELCNIWQRFLVDPNQKDRNSLEVIDSQLSIMNCE